MEQKISLKKKNKSLNNSHDGFFYFLGNLELTLL